MVKVIYVLMMNFAQRCLIVTRVCFLYEAHVAYINVCITDASLARHWPWHRVTGASIASIAESIASLGASSFASLLPSAAAAEVRRPESLTKRAWPAVEAFFPNNPEAATLTNA